MSNNKSIKNAVIIIKIIINCDCHFAVIIIIIK